MMLLESSEQEHSEIHTSPLLPPSGPWLRLASYGHPQGSLLMFVFGFFFFTCAENVIGEADSNPSFLCKDRQDENSIQTSNGKQKINFEQIQDSCMWEGPNVQIRACATILNQTSASKKYGSVLACLLCSVSNVFVCLCVFLCVLAEGMRGISSEQGGHTELFILHCPKGCKWL